jgi:hypothetical protein
MSAIATTIPKSAVLSARNEVFRAVESEVSVTQMLRAPFETGFPSASFCAAAGSFVPALSLGSAAGMWRPVEGVAAVERHALPCSLLALLHSRLPLQERPEWLCSKNEEEPSARCVGRARAIDRCGGAKHFLLALTL